MLPSHLRGEHSGAGADAPTHYGLCDPATFNSLTDLVLFCASNLQNTDRLDCLRPIKGSRVDYYSPLPGQQSSPLQECLDNAGHGQ